MQFTVSVFFGFLLLRLVGCHYLKTRPGGVPALTKLIAGDTFNQEEWLNSFCTLKFANFFVILLDTVTIASHTAFSLISNRTVVFFSQKKTNVSFRLKPVELCLCNAIVFFYRTI